MSCDIRNVNCTIEWRLKIFSDQLLTSNKVFNVRVDISQRKIGFYTQIIILPKPPLLHVHIRGDAVAI